MARSDQENEYTYFCLLANSLVDNIVVLDNLFLDSIFEILKTSFLLLQVNVAETTIEQNLARIQLEHETQLGIVDHGVASEVEQGIVEVGKGLFEVAEQEVGDTLLKVGDGEVLV